MQLPTNSVLYRYKTNQLICAFLLDPIERVDVQEIFLNILHFGDDPDETFVRDTTKPLTKATLNLNLLDTNNTFVPYSFHKDVDTGDTTVRYISLR